MSWLWGRAGRHRAQCIGRIWEAQRYHLSMEWDKLEVPQVPNSLRKSLMLWPVVKIIEQEPIELGAKQDEEGEKEDQSCPKE